MFHYSWKIHIFNLKAKRQAFNAKPYKGFLAAFLFNVYKFYALNFTF